jgi:hypothetical protein
MDKMNSNKLGSFSYTGTGSTTLGLVGSMTGSGHVGSQSYPYDHEWKYKYSNFGKTLATACQTNCFQGEAFAAYDPCGNMISLVAQSSGEVWARAVDKNSDATIGIYNPYNMEIPFSAQATIHPSYDQPINGPIEFHIPEQGQWDLKELLANMTRVNTTIGESGVDASSSGDDDCADEICGEAKTAYDEFCDCMEACYKNKGDGTWGHWEDELEAIATWNYYQQFINKQDLDTLFTVNLGLVGLVFGGIPVLIKKIVGGAQFGWQLLKPYTGKGEPTWTQSKKAQNKLKEAFPWIKSVQDRTSRAQAARNCLSSCSHHIDRDIIQVKPGQRLCAPSTT